jgi:hypothetical protein
MLWSQNLAKEEIIAKFKCKNHIECRLVIEGWIGKVRLVGLFLKWETPSSLTLGHY